MKDGKYEEALERARAGKPIDEVFPELKESNDERIRKELEKAAKDWYKENYEGENPQGKALMISAYIDGALAWLEKQGGQKPIYKEQLALSEEDEKCFDAILCDIVTADKYFGGRSTYIEKRKWLESLRPQPHWKPSYEQMEWLESAVRLSTDKPHIHGIIISLYEQLKRLL